jgi:hypothetical protein
MHDSTFASTANAKVYITRSDALYLEGTFSFVAPPLPNDPNTSY